MSADGGIIVVVVLLLLLCLIAGRFLSPPVPRRRNMCRRLLRERLARQAVKEASAAAAAAAAAAELRQEGRWATAPPAVDSRSLGAVANEVAAGLAKPAAEANAAAKGEATSADPIGPELPVVVGMPKRTADGLAIRAAPVVTVLLQMATIWCIAKIGPNMGGYLDGRSVDNWGATCRVTHAVFPPLFPIGTEFPPTLPYPYELCDTLGLNRADRHPRKMLQVFEGMYNIVLKSADEQPADGWQNEDGVALVLAFARKISVEPVLSPYDRFGGKALGTACMQLVCRSGGDGKSGSLPKKRWLPGLGEAPLFDEFYAVLFGAASAGTLWLGALGKLGDSREAAAGLLLFVVMAQELLGIVRRHAAIPRIGGGYPGVLLEKLATQGSSVYGIARLLHRWMHDYWRHSMTPAQRSAVDVLLLSCYFGKEAGYYMLFETLLPPTAIFALHEYSGHIDWRRWTSAYHAHAPGTDVFYELVGHRVGAEVKAVVKASKDAEGFVTLTPGFEELSVLLGEDLEQQTGTPRGKFHALRRDGLRRLFNPIGVSAVGQRGSMVLGGGVQWTLATKDHDDTDDRLSGPPMRHDLVPTLLRRVQALTHRLARKFFLEATQLMSHCTPRWAGALYTRCFEFSGVQLAEQLDEARRLDAQLAAPERLITVTAGVSRVIASWTGPRVTQTALLMVLQDGRPGTLDGQYGLLEEGLSLAEGLLAGLTEEQARELSAAQGLAQEQARAAARRRGGAISEAQSQAAERLRARRAPLAQAKAQAKAQAEAQAKAQAKAQIQAEVARQNAAHEAKLALSTRQRAMTPHERQVLLVQARLDHGTEIHSVTALARHLEGTKRDLTAWLRGERVHRPKVARVGAAAHAWAQHDAQRSAPAAWW
jgi:hypothetical protein